MIRSIVLSSWKRHRLIHNHADVQNVVLHCGLHVGVNLSKNNGCNNSSCTCRTPHSNLNILYDTSWMGMDFFLNFILRVHVSTELKPSYTINQDECGKGGGGGLFVHLAFCFMSCTVQFVKYICVIWMQMQRFCCVSCWWHIQACVLFISSQYFS